MNHPSLDENRLLREESRSLRDKLLMARIALRLQSERTARLCEESRARRDASRQPSRQS